MSSEPTTDEPRKDARFGRLRSTGAMIFIHPCSICGLANAAFGFNVSLRNGRFGDWYCSDHLPAEYRTTTKRKPE